MKICLECNKVVVGTAKWYTLPWKMCWGHNKQVSELEPLTSSEISKNDLLLICDMDERKSKKIKVGDLIEYIKQNGR